MNCFLCISLKILSWTLPSAVSATPAKHIRSSATWTTRRFWHMACRNPPVVQWWLAHKWGPIDTCWIRSPDVTLNSYSPTFSAPLLPSLNADKTGQPSLTELMEDCLLSAPDPKAAEACSLTKLEAEWHVPNKSQVGVVWSPSQDHARTPIIAMS